MQRIWSGTIGALILVGGAEAATVKVSATSLRNGVLGYFVVDTTGWVGPQHVYASQYVDYSFLDPVSGIKLDPTTVDGDTGFTVFDEVAGSWTVIGGGGNSLSDMDVTSPIHPSIGAHLWIAGTYYVSFKAPGVSHNSNDVTWSTETISAVVPVPAAAPLLLGGLVGLSRMARRRTA